MNLSSLDATIRALTPSERRYKSGETFHAFDSLPLIEHHGQMVRLMRFNTTSPNMYAIHNFLFIKKHSRYLPHPMHIHDWIEINYMYSGRCPQIINGISYILEEGQVVLIDTDTPHSMDFPLGDNDIMISLVINKQYLSSNFFNRLSRDSILSSFFINAISENTGHNNYILFHSEHSRKLQVFFHELLCEMYDPSINNNDMVNSLVTLVLCELINVYENDLERQNLYMKKNSISPILRFIESNYNTCTLDSMAKFFNMNPNYLTTLLKQKTGSSYKELVLKQRLARAAQMLRNTSWNVTDVANEVGYENISFFYKKFKEQYGCSPKDYRLGSKIL